VLFYFLFFMCTMHIFNFIANDFIWVRDSELYLEKCSLLNMALRLC
jgi:hypothetical protein